MRVFFLLSLYLNKAKAQISFLIPNIDICKGMKEWSRVTLLYQTFCPVWAEIRTILVPKYERHEGFVGV